MVTPSPDEVQVHDREAWNTDLATLRQVQEFHFADRLISDDSAGERVADFVILLATSLQDDPANIRLKIRDQAKYLDRQLQFGNRGLHVACHFLEKHWLYGDVVKDWREASYQ